MVTLFSPLFKQSFYLYLSVKNRYNTHILRKETGIKPILHMVSIWTLLLYSGLGMLVVFFAWRVKELKNELKQIEEENERKKEQDKSIRNFDE